MNSRNGNFKFNCVLLAVALSLVAFLIALLINGLGERPLQKSIRLNASASAEVQVCGEHIFYLEGSSLHCVDSSGKYIWNLGVESGSTFTASKYGVAVRSANRVRLIDADTGVSVGNISSSGNALSAIVCDVYAAAVFGPEHNSSVIITDRYGNTVDEITSLDGLTVMDCGFFEGRSLFWLMTLDSSGSKPSCSISTYKPGKRETGNITDMDQVIYKVMFRSSYICAVGTNFLKLYDYTGNELTASRKTVYGWLLESVAEGDDPLMVFVPSSQDSLGATMQDMRLIKGDSESSLHFPVGCTRLIASGTTVYGFSNTTLAVGSFGSSESKVYALPITVDSVVGITADHTAVVRSGSAIFMITLP